MTPVAAIDCGTNAIRLLVASEDGDGSLHEHVRLMRTVRLGEGVDRTGEFAPTALARTFEAVSEYAGIISDLGVGRVRFVATSASRDVSNRQAFIDGVRTRIGVDPEVITGAEEATLSFSGAVRGLPADLVRPPVLVVDIGGGSTEFVLGTDGPQASASVDIGCVRMTERHLAGDPPTNDELEAARADIGRAVDEALTEVRPTGAATMVGLAGSVTTVAALVLGLDRYDAERLHGSVITREQVDRATRQLAAMTRAERAALPFMHPGRVDVIAGGALILQAAMTAGGFDTVVVSETDILDGIVYRLLAS